MSLYYNSRFTRNVDGLFEKLKNQQAFLKSLEVYTKRTTIASDDVTMKERMKQQKPWDVLLGMMRYIKSKQQDWTPDVRWLHRNLEWVYLTLLSVGIPGFLCFSAIFCAVSVVFSPLLIIFIVMYYYMCTSQPQLYYDHLSTKSKEIIRHCKLLHKK
jgi:hypothetical protein